MTAMPVVLSIACCCYKYKGQARIFPEGVVLPNVITLNLMVDLNDLMFEVRAIDKVTRHLILVVV